MNIEISEESGERLLKDTDVMGLLKEASGRLTHAKADEHGSYAMKPIALAGSVEAIKSRVEYYQIALREESEASANLRKAQEAVAKAQEAHDEANTQLILAREGMFNACGLQLK